MNVDNKPFGLIDKFLRFISKHIIWVVGAGGLYIVYGVFVYMGWVPSSEPLNDWAENLTTRIDQVTIWLAGLTFLYSARLWRKEWRDEERITIKIVCEEDNQLVKELEYQPMRQECSRAEIQGLLRVFYGGEYYDSTVLIQQKFLERLYDVQKGNADELKIYFQREHYDKFIGKE